jgi:LuxR family transcriptional regulator, maltose regulon positive regulatory protein
VGSCGPSTVDSPRLAVARGSRRNAGVPTPGRFHVSRRRIDALLDEGVEHPLVLVSAPAGAGKTVALSSWASRRLPEERVAWRSLDADHDDPAVYWPSLAVALDLPDADGVWGPDDLVVRLVESAGHRVLVLDDFHLVSNPDLHAGTARLVSEACPPLHLVLASRHDPPLPLARLRAEGSLREIRAGDLRFHHGELASLLDRTTGPRLSPDDVQRLVDRTEGWAVGIQLAVISLAQHDDPGTFVAAFAGDDRHVADYLRDEVLARVPDDLRAFLLDTAILDRLTAPLCEAVTESGGAQSVLEEVERRNLFLVPLDPRRHWYRYHHLFAEWLRLLPTAGVEARHRRAADWFADHGFPGDAVRHYLDAGEAERAADVIEAERWVLVGQGRQATLREWTRRLPPTVLHDRVPLALAAAWIAYDQGRWSEVEHLVDAIGSGATAGGAAGALVQAEVALLGAGRLAALGRMEEAGRAAEAGLALVPEGEPRARTGLQLVLGKAELAGGALAPARRRFLDARALASRFGVVVVELIANAHLAEIDRREGMGRAAEEGARAALRLAGAAGLLEHPECAVAHLTLGRVLLEDGRVEEAAAQVERGEELAARVAYEPRAVAAAEARHQLAERTAAGRSGALDATLTRQERAVLRLLPSSLAAREIAGELCLSVNTVKTHTRSLYRKLGVQTRHAAIEEARRRAML